MRIKNIRPNNKQHYVSFGLFIGLAIGGIIGDETIHAGFGALAGMYIGLKLGDFFDSNKRKKDKELSDEGT